MYNNIQIRDTEGILMLQNGTGKLKDGVMKVTGTMESGQSFTVNDGYKLKDEVAGWSGKGPYLGFANGRYEFKID